MSELHREDSLSKGHLDIGGQRTGLDRLRCHVLAIVNPHGVVVPPASMLCALDQMRYSHVQVLSYERGIGSGLQHLGPMIAPRAHEHLWPTILDCLSTPPPTLSAVFTLRIWLRSMSLLASGWRSSMSFHHRDQTSKGKDRSHADGSRASSATNLTRKQLHNGR